MPYCVAVGCHTRDSQGVPMHRFPRDPARRIWWTGRVSRGPKNDGWNAYNNNAFHCDMSIISSVLCDIFIYLSDKIWWHWRNEVIIQYSRPGFSIFVREGRAKKQLIVPHKWITIQHKRPQIFSIESSESQFTDDSYAMNLRNNEEMKLGKKSKNFRVIS